MKIKAFLSLFVLVSFIFVGAAYAKHRKLQVIHVSMLNNVGNVLWTDQSKQIGDNQAIILELISHNKLGIRRLAVLAGTDTAIFIAYFFAKYHIEHVVRYVLLYEGKTEGYNNPGQIWATFPYWGNSTVADWNRLDREDQREILKVYKIARRTKRQILFEVKGGIEH